MDDAKTRKIVQEEIRKNDSRGRFGFKNIPYHTHNGLDSKQAAQANIIPTSSVSGSVTLAQETVYTLNLNASFTPQSVIAYGNVIDSGTNRYMFYGSAQLTPSFYFQINNSTSVTAGGAQYPFIDPNHPEYGQNIPMQSSVYFGSESNGGARHTLVGNFHIIDIQYPAGTSHARATVIDFSRDKITIVVDALDSGWEINANFVVQ